LNNVRELCHCSNSSFFFSRRRRHTRWPRDWSSYVCSSDLSARVPRRGLAIGGVGERQRGRAGERERIEAHDLGAARAQELGGAQDRKSVVEGKGEEPCCGCCSSW